jgi:hypothetical protein
MSTVTIPTKSDKPDVSVDVREALFNSGDVGPIKHVQVSTERIVSLRGILFDLDPDIFKPGTIVPAVPRDPAEFYAAVVRPMLDRHSVLTKAEVRNSGRGLHAVLRFDKPVEFNSDGERDRWSGIVQVIQAALPIDPDQPHITSTTRSVGSINSKNNAEVTVLAEGTPVTAEEVLGLYQELIKAPFKTVMKILTGDVAMQPCPFCGKDGTKLSALDFAGQCYGSCGDMTLEQLYDLVLARRVAGRGTSDNA